MDNSPVELRRSLAVEIRAGKAKWINLRGLSFEDRDVHRAFCHTIGLFGLDGDAESHQPTIAVLDWTLVERITAEAIALYRVLLRRLLARQVRTVVCLPVARDIHRIVADACQPNDAPHAEWISSPIIRQFTFDAPVGISEISNSNSAQLFCIGLQRAMLQLQIEQATRETLSSITLEAIANALEHAQAKSIFAFVLLLPRNRPKVLQIAIADDGRGIPASIIDHPRFEWLAYLHAVSALEHVVVNTATLREPEEGALGLRAKGGFGQSIRLFLSRCDGRVLVRSGAALIEQVSGAPEEYRRFHLDYGFGTQIRIEFRL